MYKPIERWRQIPGFPIGYMVSDRGRVVTDKGYLRRPGGRVNGYKILAGSIKGKTYSYAVHRLVMLCFVGPCPEGKEVNHKNGKKYDNRLGNLEYTTHSENRLHSIRVLGKRTVRGESHGHTKLSDKQVAHIRSMTGLISQRRLAEYYKVSNQHISRLQSFINRGE